MSEKKDKRYLPDEFKPEYWKGRGVTQIVIGVVIAIFGAFTPNQGIFFVIGGIVWAIFGICLVVSDYIKEDKEIDRLIEEKEKAKRQTDNKTTKKSSDDYDNEL